MNTVGLFAFGEMGASALRALLNNLRVKWVILPYLEDQTDTEKSTYNLARTSGIPTFLVKSNLEVGNIFKDDHPDIVLVCSYNKVLPEKVLKKAKFVNVHLGDVPKFRGRANVNWAIILGMKSICISVHEVVPDLDAGNIYKKINIKITNDDTVGMVYAKINDQLEKNIASILDKVLGGFRGEAQVGEGTYCCTRLPNDGIIDWNLTSREIYDFIRAQTHPYPGAFTFFDGKRMTIWDADIPKKPKKYVGRIPGRVIEIHKNYGVEILTGDSSIVIKQITYGDKNLNSSEIIKSVKKSLGIDIVAIYERMWEMLDES